MSKSHTIAKGSFGFPFQNDYSLNKQEMETWQGHT